MLSLVVALGFGVNSAQALLIVSGDGNITNPLNNSNGWGDENDGNKQFFSNILQGGTTVKVLNSNHSGSASFFDTDVDGYYGSLAGVTSSIHTGTVTDATLAGVDLFVAPLPDDAFTASEIATFGSFLSGGGSLFLLGENSVFPTNNGWINSVLTGLGSGLSIIDDSFDPRFFPSLIYPTATGSQIASDPLTTGVSSFSYSASSQVSGGTSLFFGSSGQTFVAYESVPEPSTMLLLGIGLLGLIGTKVRHRFKKVKA